MKFSRSLGKILESKIGTGKAIVLTGPRQVGKTTLIDSLLQNKSFLHLNCDDPVDRAELSSPNTSELKSMLKNVKHLFIDEAQRIPNIGLTLKLITDQLEEVQLWVTGSSSIFLNAQSTEPLTGRKWTYHLLPISWQEYENGVGRLESLKQFNNRLVYGFYPDVLNRPGDEKEVLRNLTQDYLYKDLLALEDIRKPEKLEKLVRALALQVTGEVSYNELSRLVGLNRATVESYINALIQGFVIFRIPSFSRNVRKEIKKNQKIYFYDNGILNAVLGSFQKPELRPDKGALWENFLMAERMKMNSYFHPWRKMHFWRTTDQAEVDLIESEDQKLDAYEFTWNPRKKSKISKTFTKNYAATKCAVVHTGNFREFLIEPQES